MKKVCIVGVGLIGGSLGMALKKRRQSGKRQFHITGVGRELAHLRLAKKLGAVDDFSTSAAKAVAQADVVVLCVPVPQIVPVLRGISRYLKPGAVVTDVGSVKQTVVEDARKVLGKRKDVFFVGGHPIAGSEKTGVRFAQPNLFKNAICVLTKDNASFGALNTVQKMWSAIGARCLMLDATSHDRWLAMTSHLPHLLAFALSAQVEAASKKNSVVSSLVGGSFRDMTRIAGADKALWKGIISHNRGQIKHAVAGFLSQLRALVP